MRLIVFLSPPDHVAGLRLKRQLERLEDVDIRWSANPKDFKRLLASGNSADTVVVFMATEVDHLMVLEVVRPYLFGCPILLILPNQDPNANRWGLRFKPRLKLGLEDDFGLVVAVLAKLQSRPTVYSGLRN
jgi:hypothetical protein